MKWDRGIRGSRGPELGARKGLATPTAGRADAAITCTGGMRGSRGQVVVAPGEVRAERAAEDGRAAGRGAAGRGAASRGAAAGRGAAGRGAARMRVAGIGAAGAEHAAGRGAAGRGAGQWEGGKEEGACGPKVGRRVDKGQSSSGSAGEQRERAFISEVLGAAK